MVVSEVPEARLSVNDKTTDSDEVYFNTKHDCTVYTQCKLDHLLNWSRLELALKPSQGGQGNERPPVL